MQQKKQWGKMFNKIVFWQDVPSTHLSYFMSEIPNISPSISVCLIANSYFSDSRKQMGWEFANEYPNITIIIKPSKMKALEILNRENTIHILSGFKYFPHSKLVLRHLNKNNIYGGFLMERPELWHFKGLLRKWFSPFIEGRFNKNAKFAFTFGQEAIDWYSKKLLDSSLVFPFLYTVPISTDEKSEALFTPEPTALDVAFVGSLIQRKGIETLIQALTIVRHTRQINLHIIGDGPLKNNLTESFPLRNSYVRVIQYGFKPNKEARFALKNADLLILPSYYDGWGAVVNEALMAGTPVICSDACGSSQMITNYKNGIIFPGNDSKRLADAIEYYLNNGKIDINTRQGIKVWAEENISPKNAAKYFISKLTLIYSNKTPSHELPWKPI